MTPATSWPTVIGTNRMISIQPGSSSAPTSEWHNPAALKSMTTSPGAVVGSGTSLRISGSPVPVIRQARMTDHSLSGRLALRRRRSHPALDRLTNVRRPAGGSALPDRVRLPHACLAGGHDEVDDRVEVERGAVDPQVVQVGIQAGGAIVAAHVLDPGPVVGWLASLGGFPVDALDLHGLPDPGLGRSAEEHV